MTLSTDLVIIEPMDPKAVFDFALAALTQGHDGPAEWHYTPASNDRYFGAGHYATTCGQGLPAWLWVHHADDGPLTIADDDWEDEEVPPCNEHSIRIDWDTGYSYRGPTGEGCGDLHARMVATVGRWLDEQGKTWWWKNEFTGEWHKGAEGLDALGDSGVEAKNWFLGTVLPAIQNGHIS